MDMRADGLSGDMDRLEVCCVGRPWICVRRDSKIGSDFVSLADDGVGEARSDTGGGINELKCNRMMKKLGVPAKFGGRQSSDSGKERWKA
jgi:hypothetical protein